MKDNKINHITRSIPAIGLMLALSLQAATAEGTDQQGWGDDSPFTGIYAFGDSLTDQGNFFALTGSPPPPYFEGRISDGPVWIEYLAEELGVGPEALVNYAVSGAATGRENSQDVPGVLEFPGLQDELDVFESELDGKAADGRALYAVWAGANDIFIGGATPEEIAVRGVENMLNAICRLHQLGARRIMVVNLPDMGATPVARDLGLSAYFSYASALYSENLAMGLDYLDALGIRTIRYDSRQVVDEILSNPDDYGLSNVSEPALITGGDPSEYFWWDRTHPTTAGHRILGREAYRIVCDHFRHAWATPRAFGRR